MPFKDKTARNAYQRAHPEHRAFDASQRAMDWDRSHKAQANERKRKWRVNHRARQLAMQRAWRHRKRLEAKAQQIATGG